MAYQLVNILFIVGLAISVLKMIAGLVVAFMSNSQTNRYVGLALLVSGVITFALFYLTQDWALQLLD